MRPQSPSGHRRQAILERKVVEIFSLLSKLDSNSGFSCPSVKRGDTRPNARLKEL